MFTAGLILALLLCFYALGKAADVVVVHIKHIGQALGIGSFLLGLLLGLFTSTPELALGISSYAENIPALSLGNLIGGIPVLLGLVLGVSLILNRKISTRGNSGSLPFILAYLFLPLLLGLDGQFGIVDGTVLVLFYFLLVYALYSWHRNDPGVAVRLSRRKHIHLDLFLTVLGIVAVLLVSSLTVHLAEQLLSMWPVPPFLLGLLVFSLGTNLPEITVALRAWRRHNAELSVNHLIGSAIVNPLLIGMFVFIRPTQNTVGPAYYLLAGSFLLLLVLFYFFYRSEDRLTRREGIGLVGCYVAFLGMQALVASV